GRSLRDRRYVIAASVAGATRHRVRAQRCWIGREPQPRAWSRCAPREHVGAIAPRRRGLPRRIGLRTAACGVKVRILNKKVKYWPYLSVNQMVKRETVALDLD